MNIGSTSLSTPIVTAVRQPASVDNKPSQQEPDRNRHDKVTDLKPAAAKPLPAAVGKGVGLLVDVSV